ncbi:MAG: Ppx/GppA family phosphatase [Firmicutes bacterium]|nr:Ppx/GppA family phosphatase [Bacillota bacterium]
MEKVAVIDLGSNSARMVLANIVANGQFVVFDELKESVRLGQDMERDGFLKPSRVAHAVKTLKMFRKLCDAAKVDKTYCFATNAVRRAKNQKSFLDEVNATCGFRFKVLTEEEEAMRVYHGVVNSLEVHKAVIVDMSGSSTHIIQYNRRHIINRANLPIGSITLTDRFRAEGLSPEKQAKAIEKYIAKELDKHQWLRELEPDVQFVGVGGTFRNLARISKRLRRYPLDMIHNLHVSYDDFCKIYNMVKVLDPTQSQRIKGLSSARTDIFSSSLAAIKPLFEMTKFQNIIVSSSGIREGLLYNHTVPTTIEKPIADILGHSIYNKLYAYGQNVKHCENVFSLSLQLFKQLRVLHKLPRSYVRVLRVAAYLHDTGSRVKFHDHHKHSLYYILNCNLFGVSHREIILAAFVAYGHRKDDFPMAEWNCFKELLLEEDRAAVLRLGVMVRIAESLDRTQACQIKSINCDVLGDSVIMKTLSDHDCSLEISDAMKIGPEFARAFKKNLEII